VSGNEDDRHFDAQPAKLGLQIETAQPRQSDVQDQAARHGWQLMLQKLGCGRECLDAQVDRAKQHAQRTEHERIIVDDVYDRLFRS
jgi:hypothetical protein